MHPAIDARVDDPFAIIVVSILRDGAARPLSDIATLAGLSRPTVHNVVERLEQLGWVERLEPPAQARKAGRPSMRYRFRAEAAVVAGVDFSVHKLLVVIHDLAGRKVGEHRITPGQHYSGAARVDLAHDAIVEALTRHAPAAKLAAIGVGVPGMVDGHGRVTVSRAMPEIEGIDLAHRLSGRLGCAVTVEGDSHAATLGEHTFGAGRGTRDLIYLVAGHRTGSGAIIDGKLHRGWSGAAGQVGELDYLPWYHAAENLISNAGPESVGDTALGVFRKAADGDTRAAQAVEKYVDDLAVGLATLVLALDPELVVIGGGISKAGAELATKLRGRLVHHARLANPRVEISELGDSAAALGCVRLAMNHVETQIFDMSALPRTAEGKG